jgi:hypothetical protein
VQRTAVPDDREGVGADAVGGRFHDGEGDGRGQCRIDSVAACMQDLQTGLRGERL